MEEIGAIEIINKLKTFDDKRNFFMENGKKHNLID